jgi:hypothetical protein
MDISLIASSVRPHLWPEFFKSLESTRCWYEVVFAGNLENPPKYEGLRYIQTGNIKPAQCYEVARRKASGEFVMWVADDAEFSPGLLDGIVDAMRLDKLLLSVKTVEDGKECPLDNHRFFDRDQNTPLMAPLGVINRQYLEHLGGFDRRYVAGQYENDVAMRVYADRGVVQKYEKGTVFIEHQKKHGNSTKFWTGYNHDRKILEDTWVKQGYVEAQRPLTVFKGTKWEHFFPIENREVSKTPLLPFEPYEDRPLLEKSQSHKGQWE